MGSWTTFIGVRSQHSPLTHHYAIRYTRPESFDKLTIEGILHGYSDADWAGQTDDRRSTSGYVFFVAGGPVSWQSKTQK